MAEHSSKELGLHYVCGAGVMRHQSVVWGDFWLDFDKGLGFVAVFYKADRHSHGARRPVAALREEIGNMLLSS